MNDPLVKLLDTLDREAHGEDRPLPTQWANLNIGLGGGFRSGTFNLFVGEAGSAKTYIAQAICLFAEQKGWRWAYWPFERDDTYAARRFMALIANKWAVLDPENATQTVAMLNEIEHFNVLARMSQHIEQNPRQMRIDDEGFVYVPRCEYRGVLNRLQTLCEARDLVVLDPLTMLSFDDNGHDAWKGQEAFAKDAAAIAAQTKARLLIVHHTRKAAPGGKPRQLGLDEVAGAAALSRFADNVIFLEHHADSLESEVLDSVGISRLKTHKRVLYIAKARDGRGTGWRLACDLSDDGPTLIEHGFIKKATR